MPANAPDQFSVTYNNVALVCQDTSTNGLSNAKLGINTVILALSRRFRFPQKLVGADNSVYVTPAIGAGVQILNIANDVDRIENVWWVDLASTIWILDQITDDEEWLQSVDENTSGQPIIFRTFIPASSGYNVMQIWEGPNAAWVSESTGKLYYSYWQQLTKLVNDTDVPAIPYSLQNVLYNGGIYETAKIQGDTELMAVYKADYDNDMKEIEAWIIRQAAKDGQMQPDEALGVFGGQSGMRGYKPA
jgi:hypothetical protein